ncbi:hypothetical protein B0H19DRAFT_1068827 [Mycena capillaripes]|nr:hypothetical protein B0H19DRAFT_1068827 [Mycena capillaripes]
MSPHCWNFAAASGVQILATLPVQDVFGFTFRCHFTAPISPQNKIKFGAEHYLEIDFKVTVEGCTILPKWHGLSAPMEELRGLQETKSAHGRRQDQDRDEKMKCPHTQVFDPQNGPKPKFPRVAKPKGSAIISTFGAQLPNFCDRDFGVGLWVNPKYSGSASIQLEPISQPALNYHGGEFQQHVQNSSLARGAIWINIVEDACSTEARVMHDTDPLSA